MSKFIIQGGIPLSGTHVTPGNKNAALPMIAAAMLADSPVEITNLPLIVDVFVMLDLAKAIGAAVKLNKEERTAVIDPRGITASELPEELCRKIRTSVLFAGSLIAKTKYVKIPPPGGDIIGRRRLDPHFDGLRRLGIKIPENKIPFEFRLNKHLAGSKIILDEASVTATENIIMAAAKARGITEIFNAACEPHVQNLCQMIELMGGKIDGIGTNRLIIHGVEKLNGCSARIQPDYIESASFIAAAAATKGSIIIKDTIKEDFDILGKPFRKLGVQWVQDKSGTLVFECPKKGLTITPDVFGAIPKIEDGIWPSIPTDLLSVLIVLATQAEGIVLFFEKMFESRMYFVDHLIGMGAQIVQCDPHRVVVKGRSKLRSTIMSSPDIRAGMALLAAGLCAEGQTIIGNAESIDRGYEPVEKSLSELGADIVRDT